MRTPSVLSLLLLIAAAGPLAAQGAAPGASPAPAGRVVVGEPLAAGANSFTEAQVRERFGRMGFGEVRDLHKDETGIWRGTATHAGAQVRIGMDYKGNVAAQ